jgi:hypothetical protein
MVQVAHIMNVDDARGAPFALTLNSRALMPHVLVDDQLIATVEYVQERHRATFADKRRGGVNFGHGKFATHRRDCIPFASVCLLASEELLARKLPGVTIDNGRCRNEVRNEALLSVGDRESLCLKSARSGSVVVMENFGKFTGTARDLRQPLVRSLAVSCGRRHQTREDAGAAVAGLHTRCARSNPLPSNVRG